MLTGTLNTFALVLCIGPVAVAAMLLIVFAWYLIRWSVLAHQIKLAKLKTEKAQKQAAIWIDHREMLQHEYGPPAHDERPR